MAKKKTTKSMPAITWQFFLPTVGAFLIAWVFSLDVMLSFQIAAVVLIFSFFGRWLSKR